MLHEVTEAHSKAKIITIIIIMNVNDDIITNSQILFYIIHTNLGRRSRSSLPKAQVWIIITTIL